jgi:predicted outer membrane protein
MKIKLTSGFIAACVIATAGTVCAADTSVNSRDNHFIREFSRLSFEIERIGQLAQTQSQDAQIRELGQKLLQDYKQAGQQVATVEQSSGVGQASQTSASTVREINKLAGLSGVAFDQAAIRKLFKREESGAQQLELEMSNSGNLTLRQLAALLKTDLEPDLWQTAQLDADYNGHVRL